MSSGLLTNRLRETRPSPAGCPTISWMLSSLICASLLNLVRVGCGLLELCPNIAFSDPRSQLQYGLKGYYGLQPTITQQTVLLLVNSDETKSHF